MEKSVEECMNEKGMNRSIEVCLNGWLS